MDRISKSERTYEWLRALAQPVTYLGVAMLVAIAATLAYLIAQDRHQASRQAIRQGENLSRLFGDSVARSFKSADATLLFLRWLHQHNTSNKRILAWVTNPELKNELTFQYSLIAPDGVIADSSYGGQVIGISVADRAHFRIHVSAEEDKLYISEPLVLRTTGAQSIMLSRRLSAPDGTFAGVIAASFDIVQLEKIYQSIDLGKGGVMTLTGLDGIVRAASIESRSRPALIGRNVRNSSAFVALEKSPIGHFWNLDTLSGQRERFDGIKRLIFYRLVDGYPLLASIGISEDAVFEHARRNAWIYWGITGILTAGILIAIVISTIRQHRLTSAAQEIVRQAYHDDLTNLANRVAFRREIDCALARSTSSGQPFNILLLDLDNFKSVNDTMGHPAGDELIRQVADRLRAAVRSTDVVGRIGGDEFAIIQTPDHDPRDAAVELALRLIETIGQPYDICGHNTIIETSIGIAQSQIHGNIAEQLLQRADLALYRAKFGGRRTFCIFESEMEIEARRQFELERDLRSAIDGNEIEVYYQLLVDADGGEIRGAEALIRWHHPRKGIVMPDEFIPVAESTGLIVPLGELILRRACLEAVEWAPHIKIAVNLSPVQFRIGDLVGTISNALMQAGLAPERLELEITESVLLQDDDANLAKLHELKSIGVSIALDDFGTGYSSLSYLRAFPFDKIKIDRSFVAEMTTRSDCAAIVCAVTGLARSLNVTTTAEGVETAEQLELLRAAGCEQAQGYLFGRPCPASELQLGPTRELRPEAAVA
jgi:diguanylate cyclase (GGDEF)-like protein